MTLKLVTPNLRLLPSYLEAVREGFKNMQLGFGNNTAEEIEQNPEGYIVELQEAPPFVFKLDDAQKYTISEHEVFWITDGRQFIGSLVMRYKGDKELLEDYAGHRGLAIRPSLRGQGFGKRAWRDTFNDMASRAKAYGLDFLYVTCDPDNKASAHLIELNGGVLEEHSKNSLGQGPNLRYKLML